MFVSHLMVGGEGNWEPFDGEVNWQDIRAAILALDGVEYDDVILQGDREAPFMAVSGGEDGLYLCTMTTDADEQFVLVTLHTA